MKQVKKLASPNPVAKNARTYNKATVQRDRTKYNKNIKHKGRKDLYSSVADLAA